MKFFRHYFSHQSGATAVEFGMVSLLFLSFLFGIIELGRVFWTMNALQYAIEDTARYAQVNTDATDAELVAYAATSMSGVTADTAPLTVTTQQTTISGISFIEVNGTYTFTTMVPFLPAAMNTINLTAQSRIPYSL